MITKTAQEMTLANDLAGVTHDQAPPLFTRY